MTNSEQSRDGGKVIDALLTLLNEERLEEIIDAPLRAAATTFSCAAPQPFTHKAFHQVIAGLTQHVFRHGLRPPRTLGTDQALSEALDLLAGDYDSAYLNAAEPGPGALDGVLGQLVESLIQRERRQYVRWVLRTHVDPTDYELRCRLAAELQRRLAPHLPESISRCTPEQLANLYPVLLDMQIRTDRQISQLAFDPHAINER